jgi:hypothetical protein
MTTRSQELELAGLGVGAHRWSRRDVLKPDPGQLLDGAVVGRSSLPEFLPGKHLRWERIFAHWP